MQFSPQIDSSSLPPQNIDAEESILGGILLDPEALRRVEHLLVPQAFYVRAHEQIYSAAIDLYSQGKPTDLMTVTTWLADRGWLEKIGGTSKLANLVSRTVSAVNIDRYAELVMDKYCRRQLISTGCEIAELGYDTASSLDLVLERSEQKVFSISRQRLTSATEHNSEITSYAYNQLEKDLPIYPTGIPDLDRLIVGFEPGTLTILAGRPSMGKSYLANFLAFQMMLLHSMPVLFFSLEMTKQQLAYRQWSLISVLDRYQHLGLTPIQSDRIRKYRAKLEPLTDKEIENIAKIVGIAADLPLYTNDNRSITVSSIASECRQVLAKEGKLGLVVIDYLQMMAAETGGNRSYELGDVARGLYKIAGDLNVPVLALSQINRAVEGRNNKRPTIADLSQSGILEMVADNIILLYRDEYYNLESIEEGILELSLAKSRHGETGTVKVLFDKRYGFIEQLDARE